MEKRFAEGFVSVLGVLILLGVGVFYLAGFGLIQDSPYASLDGGDSKGASAGGLPYCNQLQAPGSFNVVNKDEVRLAPPSSPSDLDGTIQPPRIPMPTPPELDNGFCSPIFTEDATFSYVPICGDRCALSRMVVWEKYQDCNGVERTYASYVLDNEFTQDIFLPTDSFGLLCTPIIERSQETFGEADTSVCDAQCLCLGPPGFSDASLDHAVEYIRMFKVTETIWSDVNSSGHDNNFNDRSRKLEECTRIDTAALTGPHCTGFDLPEPTPPNTSYVPYGSFLVTKVRGEEHCELLV